MLLASSCQPALQVKKVLLHLFPHLSLVSSLHACQTFFHCLLDLPSPGQRTLRIHIVSVQLDRAYHVRDPFIECAHLQENLPLKHAAVCLARIGTADLLQFEERGLKLAVGPQLLDGAVRF